MTYTAADVKWIKCEHIPEDYKLDPHGYTYYLGNQTMLSVCSICRKAIAYDMLSGFMWNVPKLKIEMASNE